MVKGVVSGASEQNAFKLIGEGLFYFVPVAEREGHLPEGKEIGRDTEIETFHPGFQEL